MPKIRALKPEFWTDESVVAVQPLARLLFQGLWNYSCDNGHVHDKPRQLKMRILPADPCDVDELLDELLSAGLIGRAGGFLLVDTLGAHNRIDKRYFVTCDHDGCTKPPPGDNSEHTSSAQRAHVEPPQSTHSGPVADGDGDGDGDGDKKPARKRTADIDPQFVTFWDAYPRKVGKGQALPAWKKALKKTDAESIIESAVVFAASVKGKDPQFIANPSTWLNGERWADEVGSTRAPSQMSNEELWA